jgi:thiol-disulfide isomerase/thioredoxin
MKNISITGFLFFLSILSSAQKISFSIEGKLKDIKSNATIWLGLVEPYELKGMAFKGNVSDGKFTITGETYQPTIATLSLFLIDEKGKAKLEYPYVPKLQFFLCGGKTTVTVTDSFKTIAVKSSCPREQKKMEGLEKELADLNKTLKDHNDNLFNAMRYGDTALYSSSSAKVDAIYKQIRPILKNFISKNNSSFLSASLLMKDMSAFKTSEIDELYQSFSPALKKTEIGEEIFRQIELAKNPASKMLGAEMKDGELWDVQGNKVKLSSFKGKYLLLDFWASWCGPCRKAHPELKKLYAKYGNTKLELISISIDTDKSKWIDAIKEDGLLWPQLIDKVEPGKPEWYGKTFANYRGDSVPLSFLITPEGTLIEVNPDKQKLEKLLDDIYKVNPQN